MVTLLRDSSLYAEAAATGRSLFDLTGKRAETVREDWTSLLRFIEDAA